MTEMSTPRNSEAEADNDSLRKKLRDSLTSALEMEVSKQLVKSVLGKTSVEAELADEKLILYTECEAGGDVTMDIRNGAVVAVKLPGGEVRGLDCLSASNQVVNIDVDGGFRANVDDKQGRLSTVSTCPSDQHSEVAESPFPDFEKEATRELVEVAKGGIQLMEQAKEVAWNVELNLFSLNGGVNKKYKEKARSLLFNLKDKSNPELRARVFKGEILPEMLVSMTAGELASKELCQWRIARAQEFATMVVLTKADMDSRRILKKTHKGEVEVMVEDIVVSAGPEITGARSAFPGNGKVHTEGNKCGALGVFSRNSSLEDREVHGQALTQIPVPVLHETVEDEVEMQEPANDFKTSLPSMISRAEDIEWHRESEIKEYSRLNCSGPDGEMQPVPKFYLESSGDEMWTSALTRASDSGILKLCKSPRTSSSDAENGEVIFLSNRREGHSGSSVWEGSLQVSATRCVSVGGFYKSGVKLELKNWPRSFEVKGRVKLGVLDKFLRDLQLSRSRTVTVLSLCPSDGRGDAKRMRPYLKEIADHYRMGERAGFAEPRPGFELYLLAPGSACLDLLSDDQETLKGALKREDEVLVGVVVWRKRISSVRGPKQNCSIKKDALSNLVCESPTARLHGKETTSSRRGSSASLNAASILSLVNVSGNTPMHSDQSVDGYFDAKDLQTRDYEHLSPVSGGHHPPLSIDPLSRVAENPHVFMINSSLVPQPSYYHEYIPPRFIPQPKPSVPQVRPPVLKVQMKQYLQGTHVRSGLTPLVRDGSGEVHTQAPPGCWPKSPTKFPGCAIQNSHVVLQQDDDDLPEFNFDTEGVPHPNPAYHVTQASKPLFLSGHDNDAASQQVRGLQHISEPINRYQVHHDTRTDQSSSMEFQSVLNRLPFRHLPQQYEFSKSGSFIPCGENGCSSREDVSTLTGNISRCTSLLCSSDYKILSTPAAENLATCELLWDNLCHPPGEFGHSTRMPSGSTSSAAATLNGASHTTVHDGFSPRNCPPPLRHLGWSGLPPMLKGYPQRNSQQPCLLSMVTQHRQVESESSFLSPAGGMPLPRREPRLEWPASGSNDPSEMSSSNSERACCERKMEPMKRNFGKVRGSEFNVNDRRHNRVQ